ncbi:helix-turn-helix domain-containing protein, partial [Paenibacillus taiwanensis]|uniref:helix-turn-helix domain-containing protein n=1 Tax=Paenibacillus taiwanensis TaxID=401638 RepID=UPI00056720FE
MKFGANIKTIRKKRGLTQSELAEVTDLSRSYIADIERDRYSPSIETLLAIANALNVKIYQLIGEDVHVNRDDEDWSMEELEEIARFKEFVKSKRDQL